MKDINNFDSNLRLEPLLKRIKRHVIAKEMDFFAATAPGVEKLCLDELLSLAQVPDLSLVQVPDLNQSSVKNVKEVPGGVEFKGRLHDCYLANLQLRTANRILMRIGEFKATNFIQLEKRLADFPWELFLLGFCSNAVGSSLRLEPTDNLKPESTDRICKISVTSRHSRLYHKEAIAERFQTSISKRLAQFPASQFSLPASHLFVRAEDDHFTISLDSSGDLLYKRGIKTYSSSAPIRETIGATVLKLAGYDGKIPLIDPMCGSGTFSLEGGMIAANMPPGWFRNFAFMEWLSFRPQQWAYIKREAEKRFVKPENSPLIFASDKEKTLCDHLEKSIGEAGLSEIIQVSCKNFFDFSPAEFTDKTGLVVINPPYGNRIGTREESNTLIYNIYNHLKREYKGWKIAMILPEKHLARTIHFHLTSHIIHHGGLKLNLVLFQLPLKQ